MMINARLSKAFLLCVLSSKFIAPHKLYSIEGGWSWHPLKTLLCKEAEIMLNALTATLLPEHILWWNIYWSDCEWHHIKFMDRYWYQSLNKKSQPKYVLWERFKLIIFVNNSQIIISTNAGLHMTWVGQMPVCWNIDKFRQFFLPLRNCHWPC